MNRELMRGAIDTERLVLFPYTTESLSLFNRDLPRFEETYGVTYQGEELDELLKGFLLQLEREIAEDPENFLFFTEFLLVRREDGVILGSIDYKYVPREGVTELGYGLNPRHEGRGYMTEALRAFLDFGRSLGIKTVLADTLPDNLKSQRVLKKCGFRFLREDGNLWWEKDL
ncbi:MAG: GNAT family N-acetyltransferase [Oscillospiraceae bacterium]|nr:GNAT family N-acetyltransferase [Oscillospiraceae bacterium]